ncbi:MAG: glycosyltransferase, partial [Euryarchaeota archaeon]|nr:glycosyltransferase [Euryarchaeota archaeon]
KVLAKFSNVTFAIAGGGALMNSLVQQVSALGISHKFIFFGYREDVERLLKLADIFVISSLREGTSIAILEAMAAGVPVIATRVGGNPELIQDHVSGLLVRPCDPDLLAQAIIKLLQDKNLSGRFKQAARETAIGKYSEVVNLNRLIDLYKEVLYAKR